MATPTNDEREIIEAAIAETGRRLPMNSRGTGGGCV